MCLDTIVAASAKIGGRKGRGRLILLSLCALRRETEGMLMKKIALWVLSAVAGLLLASCDSGWPYKPVQFVAPTPPPPKHAFVSADTVAAFCGTPNVTLLYNFYVQGGETQPIYFVRLNDSNAVPIKLKKPIGYELWKSDSPMPSPDGKLVTYHMFTASGQCAAFVQKLDSTAVAVLIAEPGSDPHFYKDKQQGALFITYADTTGLLLNLLSITSHATWKQQVDSVSGQPVGSPVQIINKPFYGGISQDGRYMCTGYANTFIYDFTDSSFHAINSGLQTCNPSISTDPTLTDRMMFLNFAGVQNLNNYATTPIGEHRDVFIVDKSNSVVAFFDLSTVLDASKQEWQDPEWSNNPDYFAALASDASGNWDVYAVRISTGKTLRINNPANFHLNGTSRPYVFMGGGAS